jgi:hypothetical protein
MGIALNLSCRSVDNGGGLKLSSTIQLGMPFWSLSIALNVIATALIATKLLRQRQRLIAAGIAAEGLSSYASMSSIMIESAAAYSIAGLIFIPFQVRDSPYIAPVAMVFTAASFLCPVLIQLRIAQGIAYAREDTSRPTFVTTTIPMSTMRFASTGHSTTDTDFSPVDSEKSKHVSLVRGVPARTVL